MHRLMVFLAVILIAGLPLAVFAQEPAEGEITGQVINGTEGGGSVAGVEVTLITYVDDMMSGTRNTMTDQEGKFLFDDVVMEHTYLISARYMDVNYYYPVVFEDGATTAYVETGVCDVTTSDLAVRIAAAHTLIRVEEDGLFVTEVYWLLNDSDKTYVGTDGALIFTLPEGAFGFDAPQELLMDYQLLDNNRVAYLVPFPPGERELIYAYRLVKPDKAEFTLPLNIDYPADGLDLLVKGEGIEVAVGQLAPAEPVVGDTGERFIHFHGQNLPRGAVINVGLSGLSGGGGFPIIIIWIVAALVVIVIAVYLIMRKRGAGSER